MIKSYKDNGIKISFTYGKKGCANRNQQIIAGLNYEISKKNQSKYTVNAYN